MTDRAPNARVGRLVARVRVGRTGAEDAARRYVSTNTIPEGGTFEDLIDHPAVTMSLADGCTNLIVDGPDGALPSETMRYSPDNGSGNPVASLLHFDGAGRADGSIVDGGAIVPWLADGKEEFADAMTNQGRWWGIYHAHLRQPTFQPTNLPPHNWPTDVSRASMNSLSNWRAWYDWCLSRGMAFAGGDAEGPSLGPSGAFKGDPGYHWRTMLETPGTYDGAALGVPEYEGSFTNGQARLFYVESIPRTGHWAPSWIALYATFLARDGNLKWMQASECAHPPQVWCTQDDPEVDYAHALDLLTNRHELLVVVNYDELALAGLDMDALNAAAADDDPGGGEGEPGGVGGAVVVPLGGVRGRRRGRMRAGLEAAGIGR